MVPDELELIAEPIFYEREWIVAKSPFAEAHYYLDELDLFGGDSVTVWKQEALIFFDDRLSLVSQAFIGTLRKWN